MNMASIEVGKITMSFPITRDEAEQYIRNPAGVVAKKLHDYLHLVMETACRKFMESKKDENVTKCKINPENTCENS